MTSETEEDEKRKRRRRRLLFLQKHKRKFGWLSAAGMIVFAAGVVSPSHTVISCRDPSIRRHNTGDTITVYNLLSCAFVLPFFVMLLMEWLMPETSVPTLRASLKRSWRHYGNLIVGGVFMFFLTDVIKTCVGEARPIFWEVCQPNLTEEQCAMDYVKVTLSDCSNPYKIKHWRLINIMKSFPSGHASISVFTATFMIAYTHKKIWRTYSSLLSPWIQLAWAGWAVVCCQSRVWDNRHFWWDVVAGAVIGGAAAMATLHYLANWFEKEEEEETNHISPAKTEVSHLPSSSSSSSYMPEEEEEGDGSSRFSRTSIKRLINGEEGGGGRGGRRERELDSIKSTPT